MAANTKQLKGDVDKKSSPQYFDPALDEYGYLYGSNGASRHMLYGPDGNPITTTGNKLAVRATEIETQLTDIQGYIDGIEGAIGTAAVSPAANTLLARVKNLETKIDAIISSGIQLSGSNTTVLADYTGQNQLITTAQVGFGTMAQIGGTNTYIPIDIRKYKNKLVIVRNLHDVSVKISIVGTKSITAGSFPHFSTFILYDHALAAGASKTWYTDLINLNAPYQGLIVYAYAFPLATTGTMEVLVLGGVN